MMIASAIEADRAVDEDRVGGRTPSGAGARDQPQPDRVAPDRGRQGLVEERADHVVAHGRPSSSGAPHSALISRQRNTPTKICRNVTAIAMAIQSRLVAV